MKKGKNTMIVVIAAIAVIGAAAFGVILFAGAADKPLIVSKNLKEDMITEFYWTYSSSSYPPQYQRYHVFMKNGKLNFHYEKREGENWPLSGKDITESGTFVMSKAQQQEFFDLIKGGTVVQREDDITSGDSGPWTYLYWKNDKGKYQVYTFPSLQAAKDYENWCISLKDEDISRKLNARLQGFF